MPRPLFQAGRINDWRTRLTWPKRLWTPVGKTHDDVVPTGHRQPVQRLWCDAASPYTGVGMPSRRAFNCSARNSE